MFFFFFQSDFSLDRLQCKNPHILIFVATRSLNLVQVALDTHPGGPDIILGDESRLHFPYRRNHVQAEPGTGTGTQF